MSTRCTICYGDDTATTWNGEKVAVEPYTHIWSELMDDCVYVQVLTDPPDMQPLRDSEGRLVGYLVTLKLPPNTSVAVGEALRKHHRVKP
jgi:hypothetical protein